MQRRPIYCKGVYYLQPIKYSMLCQSIGCFPIQPLLNKPNRAYLIQYSPVLFLGISNDLLILVWLYQYQLGKNNVENYLCYVLLERYYKLKHKRIVEQKRHRPTRGIVISELRLKSGFIKLPFNINQSMMRTKYSDLI